MAIIRLQSTGRPEDVDALRRLAMEFEAGQVLSLLAELVSLEADYCLLSGDSIKANRLARRARIFSKAANAAED